MRSSKNQGKAATLELAKRLLAGHEVTTLVLKGQADHVIFPDIQRGKVTHNVMGNEG